MSRETVLSNARLVLDEEVRHGSVLIRDGLIADIGSGPRARQAWTWTATTCCPAWSSCIPTTSSATSLPGRACSGIRCPPCSPAMRSWRRPA